MADPETTQPTTKPMDAAASALGLAGQIYNMFAGSPTQPTVGGGGNSKRALAPVQLQLLASVPNIQSLFKLLAEQENAKRMSAMDGILGMGQYFGQ